MESLEQRIADGIFEVAEVEAKKHLAAEAAKDISERVVDSVFEISVTALELLGKYAVDLVERSDEVDGEGNPVRKEVAIREDRVRPAGFVSLAQLRFSIGWGSPSQSDLHRRSICRGASETYYRCFGSSQS
jgi:hypothetical protein